MLALQPAFSWLYILICLHRLKYFTSYSSLLVEKRFLILIGVQPARPSVVYFTPGCSFLISNSTTSASSRCCKGPTLWAESDVAASDSELSLTSESIVAEESWELGGGRGACGGLLLRGRICNSNLRLSTHTHIRILTVVRTHSQKRILAGRRQRRILGAGRGQQKFTINSCRCGSRGTGPRGRTRWVGTSLGGHQLERADEMPVCLPAKM